jgi:hypothetical protein
MLINSCSREGLQWSSFMNCIAFKGDAIYKKRERKARPVVFTEGHAQVKTLVIQQHKTKNISIYSTSLFPYILGVF